MVNRQGSNHADGDYFEFVTRLTDAAVRALELAKGNLSLKFAAIEAYVREGYAGNLTTGELTDFFCVDTPSVLDRAGYDGSDADEAVRIFDELHSKSHYHVR